MTSECIIKDIIYYQEVIQSILISIQIYKQHQIIGANDVNIAMNSMESLFVELSNNSIILKEQQNVNLEKISNNINNIKKDLCNNIKLYGTNNFIDFVNICVQDKYIHSICSKQISDSSIPGSGSVNGITPSTEALHVKGKVSLIMKYFHPINFKILTWKKGLRSWPT